MNNFLVQLSFLALTHPTFGIFFYLEVPYDLLTEFKHSFTSS